MSIRVLTTMYLKGVAPRLNIPVPKMSAPTIASTQITAVRNIKTTAVKSVKQAPISGFTGAGLKKNWSSIPMVVICVAVCVGVPIVSVIIGVTRPDVCYHKNWGYLADRIDLENAPYLKAVELDGPDHNIPQVAELYKDMKG